MLKSNLIYIKVYEKFLGFLDTGGGMTFQFRKPELNSKLKLLYRNERVLDDLQNKVIVFYGNDYWDGKIYLFDYIQKKFKFINKIPRNLTPYKMLNRKKNFSLFELEFEGKKQVFLFDTGATVTRNNKGYGISFLDGNIFDRLKYKYKVIKNYDDYGAPCIIIPQITIFNTIIKNVKFLRNGKNAFYKYMYGVTGVRHIGAIGGNVLKKFKIVCDYKDKVIYV